MSLLRLRTVGILLVVWVGCGGAGGGAADGGGGAAPAGHGGSGAGQAGNAGTGGSTGAAGGGGALGGNAGSGNAGRGGSGGVAGATGGGGGGGTGGGLGGAGGVGAACHVNGDCAAGEVCYLGINSCGSATGHCVEKAPSGCFGCDCLISLPGGCPSNSGGMCLGNDAPTSCWYCYLPV